MALIIEDGSIVAGANSYATLEQMREYAAARGAVLPTDDGAVEVLSTFAMDWLGTQNWIGERTSDYSNLPPAQELDWPRHGVKVNGRELPDDTIPGQIVRAQLQLVLSQQMGVVLFPTTSESSFVTREKVGPIETEYSEAVYLANSGGGIAMPVLDNLLQPFLQQTAMQFTVSRA